MNRFLFHAAGRLELILIETIKLIFRQMDRQTGGHMDRQLNIEQVDNWTIGQTDSWTDGQMDRQLNRRKNG